MLKRKEFSVSNDSIKLDSCLASISNKSKYSLKKKCEMSYLEFPQREIFEFGCG